MSPAPALSRRREVGEASARSLLITVLGEYVLPPGGPVWTSVLVRALGLLGVAEKSARQALARSAGEGWVSPARFGRRVRWELTGPGQTLLSDGARRIFSFGHAARDWDGRWLLVLASVPDSKRELRHRLRTQLAWAGFGALAAGVWVSPDPGREAEARSILAGLGLADTAMSFLGRYGSVGTQASVARQAWDLDAVGARYQDFIAAFDDAAPAAGPDFFVAQTRLVHAWRRFPFLDPQLPASLLPSDWAGTTAAELFESRHQAWQQEAQRHWETLVAEAGL
ncbi:MAG TPA: PaaX family transcriptional regulator C-terminal domain-containing protein [Streptosporangiaceae bacterium]